MGFFNFRALYYVEFLFVLSFTVFQLSVDCKFSLIWTNNSNQYAKVFKYVSNEWNLKHFYTKRVFNQSNPISIQRELCKIAKSGEKPIVGELNYELKLIIDSFTDHFDIPFITWSSVHEIPYISRLNSKSCKIFSVQPDLTKPLINYLIDWKWTSFVYIYRSEYSFYRMNKVLKHLYSIESEDSHLDILPLYLPTSESGMFNNLRLLDKKISGKSKRKIVIDLSERDELEALLRCLKLLGMLRHEYHYLMVNFRIMQLPLSSFKSSRVNITGFHILNYLDQETRSFITRWTRLLGDEELSTAAFILDAFRVIQSIISNNRFRYSKRSESKINCDTFSFEATNSTSDSKYLISYLKNINTMGQTGPIVFDNETCVRKNVTILLTKFNGQGGGELIAVSKPDDGWTRVVDTDKSSGGDSASANNKSQVLRIVTILSKPFVMRIEDNKDGSKPTANRDNFEGYCIDLADEIFTMINRSYRIHLVKDNNYGAQSRVNKTWNGIVGELIRGEADIAIAPLTVSSSRAQFISFTEPFMTFGLSLIMKKPMETKPGFFSFMKPLADYVWISTASACLLMAIGLRVISNISPYEWKREKTFDVGNSIWFTFAAVVRQGAEIFPRSPGARVVASVWWMFSLVHIAYYTANLAAFLSVANLISPISNIRDLVDKKELHIKVGTLDSGSTKEFFETSTLDPYDKVHLLMKRDKSVYTKSTDVGIKRVRDEPGKYVFILESKMNEFINHRKPCDTMMIGHPFGSKAYAVATRANDKEGLEVKEQITDAILQLRERQVLANLYTKWWIKKGECSVETGGSSRKPLALANLSGVFYILFFGILLSLLLGLVIFVCQLRRIRRRQHYRLQSNGGHNYDSSTIDQTH